MRRSTGEREIRQLLGEWEEAICTGAMTSVVRDRLADLVMFDVPEPVRLKGLDRYRESWELFFRHNPPGSSRFRLEEMEIVAGSYVAFAFGLIRIGAGTAHCRLTVGFRKIKGRWWVCHEHHSMPISID